MCLNWRLGSAEKPSLNINPKTERSFKLAAAVEVDENVLQVVRLVLLTNKTSRRSTLFVKFWTQPSKKRITTVEWTLANPVVIWPLVHIQPALQPLDLNISLEVSDSVRQDLEF